MYIYVATSDYFRSFELFKIGCTENYKDRKSTYLTGCPPNMSPNCDIKYEHIYKVDATDTAKLRKIEHIIHNEFISCRQMRKIPFDSEWFILDIKILHKYIISQSWYIKEIDEETEPPDKHILSKMYSYNTNFINNLDERLLKLKTFQDDAINKLLLFIEQSKEHAKCLIAPCSFGKTVVVSRAILVAKLQKIIIVCPQSQIQLQWANHLESFGEITILGSIGTTDKNIIQKILDHPKYCIITTYSSCELLLNSTPDIFIADEAHHTSGVILDDIGSTKKLTQYMYTANIKRLFVTYTPRNVYADAGNILSMDNAKIYGDPVYSTTLRTVIDAGILPDYRIWVISDDTRKGSNILGKCEMISNAWRSKQFIDGSEVYILNHLLIFCATNEEAHEFERFLISFDCPSIRVQGGDCIQSAIDKFAKAPRAILINCKVLGEGVDIPIADSVVITYPKQSYCEITQMLLRAGRWYKNKPIFHILLLIIDDSDQSGFEHVLTILASQDQQLCNEILNISYNSSAPKKSQTSTIMNGSSIQLINMQIFDSRDIMQCFTSIRLRINSTKSIYQICAENAIDTSIDYYKLRTQMPELPELPFKEPKTWYDFLHPHAKKVNESQWQIIADTNPQYISDGYFKDKSIIKLKNIKGRR